MYKLYVYFQGEIEIQFADMKTLKTFAKDGFMYGVKRYFNDERKFLNISTVFENELIWQETSNGHEIFACQKIANGLNRCIVTLNDFKDNKSCLVVDNDLYVECFEVTDFPHIKLKNCEIQVDKSIVPKKPESLKDLSNVRLSIGKEIKYSEINNSMDCSENLTTWLKNTNDDQLLWYTYDTENEPLDPENPEIEFEIPWLKKRMDFEGSFVTIEDYSGETKLFKGVMKNTMVKGKVDKESAKHPAWRSRLIIGFGGSRPTDGYDISDSRDVCCNFDHKRPLTSTIFKAPFIYN